LSLVVRFPDFIRIEIVIDHHFGSGSHLIFCTTNAKTK
jgi:hypothetical protein